MPTLTFKEFKHLKEKARTFFRDKILTKEELLKLRQKKKESISDQDVLDDMHEVMHEEPIGLAGAQTDLRHPDQDTLDDMHEVYA